MIAFLFKNKWRTAFLAYSLYIIYGTTLPFRFTLSRTIISEQLQNLFSLQYYQSLPASTLQLDGVSNILFFIPFGLFFISAIYQSNEGSHSRKAFGKIILSGALLSLFVESLQIFTVDRSPSVLDILTNTIGTYIGASLGYVLVQRGYREKLNLFFDKLFSNPDLFLLSGYLLYLFLAALAPFNFNLSPFRIYWNLNSVSNFDFTFHSHPSKVFGILYVFAPAGYIIARILRRHVKKSYMIQTGITIISGFALCILVELLQLFVNSRFFSWSDIYLGWIGVLYGLFAYQILHRGLYGMHIQEPWVKSKYGPRLFYFFMLNYFIFLFYKFLYPFDLGWEQVGQKIHFFLMDLYSYIPSKSLFNLLIMLIKNIILFIPAGIILYEDINRYKSRWLTAALVFIILAAKSMQLVNRQQTPLLYDFFGMGIGSALGYLFWGELKQYLFQVEAITRSKV